MVFSSAYKFFRPLWISSIIISGAKATNGTGKQIYLQLAINTKVIQDDNLRFLADSYLYIGDATLDFTSHQFKYLPTEWVKKNTAWTLSGPTRP
jgi:hypothetical protein